jgi:hypothetical protein
MLLRLSLGLNFAITELIINLVLMESLYSVANFSSQISYPGCWVRVEQVKKTNFWKKWGSHCLRQQGGILQDQGS